LHRLTERDSTLEHYFEVWGYFLVLSYFWCKIWHHILALQPWFPVKVMMFRTYLT